MHSFTSALDGDEWSASHLSCFTPKKGSPVPTRLLCQANSAELIQTWGNINHVHYVSI